MRRLTTITWIGLLLAAGCSGRGEVNFAIQAPTYAPLNPLTDAVTDFAIKRLDGSLLAAASQQPGDGQLRLGPLQPIAEPIDLQLLVQSGTSLLGMARLRDVEIETGVQHTYQVDVRKSLITIGSALPAESYAQNKLQAGQILDPTAGTDLALAADGPKLPSGTTAAAATWDGRFVLAANDKGIEVIDTGSGRSFGTAYLGFDPLRLAVGPRDTAVAALDASAVVLFPDVAGLTSEPGAASQQRVTLGEQMRAISFSPDGKTLYALTGGGADPCSPTAAATQPNALIALGLDGTLQGTWSFSGFMADVAYDLETQKFVVSDTTGNQVATFDRTTPFGAVTPTKIADAKCPNGLRTANGEVFVMTNERDTSSSPPGFVLMRVPIRGGTPIRLPFQSPTYHDVHIGDMPTPDGNTQVQFQFAPASLVAYEIAITPDGTRLVAATRARYSERNAALTVFLNKCRATFEIVEYGLYTLDARSGQSNYVSHSQLVGLPNQSNAAGHVDDCIACTIDDPLLGTVELDFPCDSIGGDRPAGISAVFGGP